MDKHAKAGLGASSPLHGLDTFLKSEPDDEPCDSEHKQVIACPREGCSYTSSFHSNMRRHVNTVHDKKYFRCNMCPSKFPKHCELKIHIDAKHLSSLACEKCNKKFSSKSGLSKHIKRDHELVRDYQCHICPKEFFDKTSYEEHINRHSGICPYICHVCAKAFSSLRSLRKHVKICKTQKPKDTTSHKGYTITSCGEQKEIFGCPREGCDYTSMFKTNVRRHVNTVHDKKYFRCELCSSKFPKMCDLRSHISAKHLSSLVCDQCGKTFSSRSGLGRHTKKDHKLVRRYQCHMCPKSFYEKSSYEEHINKHNGIRPYVCHICAKDFSLLSSMRRHVKVCKPRQSKDVEPVQCPYCIKQYTKSRTLQEHIQAKHSQRERRCCPCGKTFEWAQSYNRHIKACPQGRRLCKVKSEADLPVPQTTMTSLETPM